ncbi:MAG: hypothetical protein KDB53_20765 [Planctomycetes bacterium]|nr:hypothetical protein [Planctomycetota bacterium]
MLKRSTCICLLVVGILTVLAPAQNPSGPGPYPVGTLVLVDQAPVSPPGRPPEMYGASPSPAILGICFYPANPQAVPPSTAPFDWVGALSRPAAQGQFPLVAFQHGWAATPIDYELYLAHLASWGFVVVAPTYLELTATFQPDFDALDPVTQAMNTYALLHHVNSLSQQDPTVPIYGRVACGPGARWATVGHSMGGTANFYLAAIEERIDVLVSCNPYVDTINGLAALPPISNACSTVPTGLSGRANNAIRLAEEFKGASLYLSGNADPFTPPAAARFWFDRGPLGAGRPRRSLLLEFNGFGHFSITDSTLGNLNVAFCGYPTFGLVVGSEQHRSMRTATATFLRAELGVGAHDNDDLYATILGQDATNATVNLVAGGTINALSGIDSDCLEPIAFQSTAGPMVRFGFAGLSTDLMVLHAFLDDLHGFVQAFPMPSFNYPGYQRIDPAIPSAWYAVPAFPTVGLIQLEFPNLAPTIQAGLAARAIRTGSLVSTRLLKLP